MIKNEKQYQVTKSRLVDFQEGLKKIIEQDLDPLLKELQVKAIESQIEDFENDLMEYQALKNGHVDYVNISIEDLPEALIKARLSKNWSQSELADKLKMKEQQVQRYESINYATASFPRLINIANILGVQFFPVRIKLGDNPIEVTGYSKEAIATAQRKLREKKSLISVR